jgi:dipeptidyl aminopeptidase/acylaminoacyl peptidase
MPMATLPLTRRSLIATLAGGAAVAIEPAALARLAAARAEDAALAPLVPRRLYFEDAERTGVRLSPKGTMLAWLAPVDGVRNLWVAPVDDIGQARPATRVTDRAISFVFFWAWTEKHVVIFREEAGDENWRAIGIDIETGEAVPLTPERGVRAFHQQRGRRYPTEMLFVHNARDKRYFDLHRVDITTGASSLAFENNEFVRLYTDPRFALRFAARTRRDGAREYLERKPDGGWAPFLEVPLEDEATTFITGLSNDGRSVFLADSRGRDKAALFEIDLETRAATLLAEDPEADIREVISMPGTGRPIAALAKAAKSRWHVVDERFAPDFARLAEFAGTGEIGFGGVGADLRRVSVFVDRDDSSGEFALLDREDKSARRLFKTRPRLDAAGALRPMLPVTIPARDGLRLVSYLTLPRDDFRNGPAVLVIHGGPYARDQWGFNSVHQWLANRGYAVLSVNYRGSTGFGKEFIRAADHEWGGRMHDDLIDAAEWIVAQGYADRQRLGFLGGSYGGYAALTAATRTPEVFACIVDLFGISNLVTFMKTIPPYWSPWFAVWKRRLADPDTPEGQAWLKERSPLTHVERIVRPLLIAQGLNDVRVVAAESEQIVRAMQEKGLPVTYVTFPDEGHGFVRPQNRVAFNAAIEVFLAKHLGGRAEPIGEALAASSLRVEAGRELVPGLG